MKAWLCASPTSHRDLVGRFCDWNRRWLHRFDQRRQGSFGVRRHRQVDSEVALQVLVIALEEQGSGSDADQFRTRFHGCLRSAMHLIAKGVQCAPKVVRSRPTITSALAITFAPALCLIERMACRKIHSSRLIDHCGLKHFGQFDHLIDSGWSPRSPVDHQNGGLSAASSRAASATAPVSPCGGAANSASVPGMCLRVESHFPAIRHPLLAALAPSVASWRFGTLARRTHRNESMKSADRPI